MHRSPPHPNTIGLILLSLLLAGCANRPLLDTLRSKHETVTIHVHCGCEEAKKTKAPDR
jgi:outer membrane murein-binding lipoprotein Lpp